MSEFKSGFVNIIGFPNAGKSTLLNKLLGEKLSIVSHKAQTTRQRILGIVSNEGHQIIFSDTPGILQPVYELHHSMLLDIEEAFDDADIILYITEVHDKPEKHSDQIEKIKKLNIPYFLLINKIDLSNQTHLEEKVSLWQHIIAPNQIIPISALHNFNIQYILDIITKNLPVHPPYFPEDILTDK